MADRPPPPFNIRRLSDPAVPAVPAVPTPRPQQPPPLEPRPARQSRLPGPPPAPPARPVAPQPPPPKPEPPPEPPVTAAGRFDNASATLALLSSVAGAQLTREAVLRRGPRHEWWVELALPLETAAPLVWTAGGQPYGLIEGRWLRAAGAGNGTILRGRRDGIDVSKWTSVGIAELLAEATLRPAQYRGVQQLNVIVPGSLGRWVLRRVSLLSLSVTIAAAKRMPLVGDDTPAGALLFRIESPRGVVPATLVRSLCSLPYTIVAPWSGLESQNLLIDVRHRSPLPLTILSPMIPEGEQWVLGPPDVGHCRLVIEGEAIDGAMLLDSPVTAVVDVAPAPPASLPEPLPVRLVPQHGKRAVDAVLLDDQQLQWLTRFLVGRPLGESLFVISGDGVHFLLSPGGMPANLPFGTPLARLGAAGLYVELGRGFQPPLPAGAQRSAFGLDQESVVAVTDLGAFRFVIERLVPAWTLWIGEAPQVDEQLSAAGKRAMATIPSEVRRVAQDAASSVLSPRRLPARSRSSAPNDVPSLLQQAARAEARGNFLEAAELLEKAGEPARAGRLYERVARRMH